MSLLQKKVFDGSIDYIQIMDEEGNIDQLLFPKDLSDDTITDMYKKMSLARALDAKMLSLQRQGRAVTYAPLVGEEATQIGSAMAMRKDDIFVPSFRQHGVYLARGMDLSIFFLYWRGYEEGNAIPRQVNGTPVIVPVATQMPHASGVAFAQKYKGKDVAVVSYLGDGGTSEGDFYEAINFAGVFKLPLISIIENNQWAISVPRKSQTASETLAQKAFAAGVNGIQVDGNDVIAVYKAVQDAIAASKTGPTVIECVTYRMSLHTTADDPTKYRSDEEVNAWKPKDPLMRVRKYLDKKGLWDDKKEEAMASAHQNLIDTAVEKAEAFKPDPKTMFEHVYSFMPDVLKEELEESESSNFWNGD